MKKTVPLLILLIFFTSIGPIMASENIIGFHQEEKWGQLFIYELLNDKDTLFIRIHLAPFIQHNSDNVENAKKVARTVLERNIGMWSSVSKYPIDLIENGAWIFGDYAIIDLSVVKVNNNKPNIKNILNKFNR